MLGKGGGEGFCLLQDPAEVRAYGQAAVEEFFPLGDAVF